MKMSLPGPRILAACLAVGGLSTCIQSKTDQPAIPSVKEAVPTDAVSDNTDQVSATVDIMLVPVVEAIEEPVLPLSEFQTLIESGLKKLERPGAVTAFQDNFQNLPETHQQFLNQQSTKKIQAILADWQNSLEGRHAESNTEYLVERQIKTFSDLDVIRANVAEFPVLNSVIDQNNTTVLRYLRHHDERLLPDSSALTQGFFRHLQYSPANEQVEIIEAYKKHWLDTVIFSGLQHDLHTSELKSEFQNIAEFEKEMQASLSLAISNLGQDPREALRSAQNEIGLMSNIMMLHFLRQQQDQFIPGEDVDQYWTQLETFWEQLASINLYPLRETNGDFGRLLFFDQWFEHYDLYRYGSSAKIRQQIFTEVFEDVVAESILNSASAESAQRNYQTVISAIEGSPIAEFKGTVNIGEEACNGTMLELAEKVLALEVKKHITGYVADLYTDAKSALKSQPKKTAYQRAPDMPHFIR